MREVGRNDPCPCGSGKKYKQCHLRSEATAPPSDAERAASFHRRDGELVGQILRLSRQEFGDGWLDECLDVLGVDRIEFEQSSYHIVVPLLIYHLPTRERLLIDLFLEWNRSRLLVDDYDWLEAQRRAWLSAWEVRSVEPGIGMRIEDLLTGESRFVHEKGASGVLVNRDTILARVIDHEGLSVIAGCHPRQLPPGFAAEWTKRARSSCRSRRSKIPPERLRQSDVIVPFFTSWGAAARAMDERPLPTFANTDGDPLLLTTDQFRIPPGRREEVEGRLGAGEGVEIDSAQSGGTRFTFTRPGNTRIKSWENTVVGSALISGDALRIETNSIRRADALRGRIEQACGDLIEHKGRVHSDPKALMKKDPKRKRAVEKTPPELIQYLLKARMQHMRDWVDESVPALGGLTPRQASADVKARRKLDILLKDFENREARHPREEQIDIGELRRILGMGDSATSG